MWGLHKRERIGSRSDRIPCSASPSSKPTPNFASLSRDTIVGSGNLSFATSPKHAAAFAVHHWLARKVALVADHPPGNDEDERQFRIASTPDRSRKDLNLRD